MMMPVDVNIGYFICDMNFYIYIHTHVYIYIAPFVEEDVPGELGEQDDLFISSW